MMSSRHAVENYNYLTYADLFAGCGGLSLGLEWAGFKRVSSIEASPDASRTYFHNLIRREESVSNWRTFLDSPETQISEGLIVGDITNKFQNFLVSCRRRADHVALIAGGPPCQGFSTAGRRDPNDPRNSLVDYMVEATAELKPWAVLVENVPAINTPFNKLVPDVTPLESLLKKLDSLGYIASTFRLKSSLFGIPQNRIRIFVLGVQDNMYERLPERYRALWKVNDGISKLIPEISQIRTVGDALVDIDRDGYKYKSLYRYKTWEYARSLRFSTKLAVPAAKAGGEIIGHNELCNHELRKHSPNTIQRFDTIRLLKRLGLGENLLHKAAVESREEIIEQINARLNGRITTEAELANLISNIFEFKTHKHSQIVLDSSMPARTVTTLPDDLIHFTDSRVLSVRELARLQSFPDSFIFMGKPTTGGLRRKLETPQYSQVGNAVPPLMAREIGRFIKNILIRVTASDFTIR